ncbi:hypothetical protein LRU_00488 [Ligilactobacillus ruminis SPM0211]|uniref:Uncharacterized protein n=1 Tax=Ligilactobacillus ruminis SPM0211 TaxID=1040964 RepID=F7QYJ9_9LACO|nr:hypothetical protein LRU_00488 [Ligilactobacillus ruminis SPM0211]
MTLFFLLNIKEEGEFVDEVIAGQSFKSFGNRSEKGIGAESTRD